MIDDIQLLAREPVFPGRPFATANPLLTGAMAELQAAIDRMWQEGTVQLHTITTETHLLRVYVLPPVQAEGTLLVFDMTPIPTLLSRVRRTLTEVYRDVLYAITDGRLHLVQLAEIPELLDEKLSTRTVPLRSPRDIAECRQITSEALRAAGWTTKRILSFTLAISEAATNALRHAGGGQFALIRCHSKWVAMVADEGKGLDFALLPHSTLLKGFSTKASMGMGFTTMLQCADRVSLANSDQGVTVLLELHDQPSDSHGGEGS